MTDYLGFYVDVLEKKSPTSSESTDTLKARLVHVSCYERGAKLCCRLDDLILVDMETDEVVPRVATNRRNPYVQGVAIYSLPPLRIPPGGVESDAEEQFLVRVAGHLDMRLQKGIRRLTKDTGYREKAPLTAAVASPSDGAALEVPSDAARIAQLETQLRRSRDDMANALCEAARLRRSLAAAEEALAQQSSKLSKLEEDNWRLQQQTTAAKRHRDEEECPSCLRKLAACRRRYRSV